MTFMWNRRFLIAAALLLTSAAPVVAAEPPIRPTVSYTADITFTYGPKLKFVASFYYSPGRQRMDYSTARSRRIDMVFADAKQVIRLDISQKRFCRFRAEHLPAWNFGVSSEGVKRTLVGPDKVGKLDAQRYKVSSSTPYGDSFEGDAWIDPDGVVLKLDGTQKRGKQSRKVVMVLTNLRKTKLQNGLFQVPNGYRRVRCRTKPAGQTPKQDN